MTNTAKSMQPPILRIRFPGLMVLAALLWLLAGCAAAMGGEMPAASAPSATPSGGPQSLQDKSRTPPAATPVRATGTPAPPTLTPTATVTFTPSVTPTATRDTRLDPQKWMDWPVVPTVSGRAKEIYQKGLALGNNPRAFSKVADCQGIREVLLGNYEKPGWYKLSGENVKLQETIQAFPGSFNRNGMAVMGGFNARAVLQPQYADPAFCLPGETPVECEYRVHRPSIAIISLEVYYDNRSVENYTQYMRQIIDFFIQRGVLPILSTKADNVEKDHRYNLATARLAYEYDLPLWNWWRAAQSLYNYGMDPTRPDGFHISLEAWSVRSQTALQSLDAVWREVKDLKLAVLTPTPTPRAAPPEGLGRGDTGVKAVLPTPGPDGRVIFGLAQHKTALHLLQGVFVYDFGASQLFQVAPAGFDLQAVAPDGRRILVNRGAELFSAKPDGSDALKLMDDFYADGWPLAGAAWLADGSALIYLANRDGEPGVYAANLDGSNPRRLTGGGALPIGLLPSQDPARVAWQSGVCRAAGDCIHQAAWSTLLDGKLDRKWEGMLAPEFSADGQSAAYTVINDKDLRVLSLTTRSGGRVWAPLPEGTAVDYAWSPGGDWLAALLLERNDYSGKPRGPRIFLIKPSNFTSLEALPANLLSSMAAWSPRGDSLLVAGTELVEGGYRLDLRLLEFPSRRVKLALDGKIGGVSADYPLFTRLEWLP